jgi:hypothetical protein
VERMAKRKQKSQPRWTDVKAKLADFDRVALPGLSPSLFATHKEHQTFLHAPFGLAEDVLEPYKKTIDRWLWPDVFRRQDPFVSQAERAISDYQKAVGNPEELAELMVFYGERSAGFSSDIASDDEGYFQRRYLRLRGLTSTPCLRSSFAQTAVVRFAYAVGRDDYGRGCCSPAHSDSRA